MTIKDIARLAKVSVTTVSRVINNQKVGAKHKDRVLKIIEKYGYSPNPYAQNLRRPCADLIQCDGSCNILRRKCPKTAQKLETFPK
jgi:DNA-binding LacI/PurR family transcriptional regulator